MSRYRLLTLASAVLLGFYSLGCSEDPTEPIIPPPGEPLEKWGASFGDGLNDLGRAVAVDASGNVFMTGAFEDTVNFGGGKKISAGSQDIFVAKFGQSGKHMWSRRYGDASFQQGAGLAVDPSGSVFVTGAFEGAVDFGGGPLVTANRDLFLVKIGADGAHQWSTSFGGANFEREGGIAADASGNVVVTGSFPGTINFGGGPLTSQGNYDVFVAKFAASGAHQWSKRFGGTDSDAGTSVAFDGAGNVFVTGNFRLTTDFGGTSFTSAGESDIFVAKYDAAGNHLWSKAFGNPDLDEAMGISVDGADSVAVTGSFGSTIDFGGGPLTSLGSTDIFAVKLDENGNHVWSARFGDTDLDNGVGVVANRLGEFVLTGSFRGSVDFGGGALMSAGSGDVFVAKYDAAGNHLWSMRFGDVSGDSGQGLSLNSTGNVFVTGSFVGTVDFDGTPLTGAGGTDIFLFKLEPTGLPLSWF